MAARFAGVSGNVWLVGALLAAWFLLTKRTVATVKAVKLVGMAISKADTLSVDQSWIEAFDRVAWRVGPGDAPPVYGQPPRPAGADDSCFTGLFGVLSYDQSVVVSNGGLSTLSGQVLSTAAEWAALKITLIPYETMPAAGPCL